MFLAAFPTTPAAVGTLIVAEVSITAVLAAVAVLVVIGAAVILARRGSAAPTVRDTRPGVGDAELADFLVDSVPTSLQEATDLTRATPGPTVADEAPIAASESPSETIDPTN